MLRFGNPVPSATRRPRGHAAVPAGGAIIICARAPVPGAVKTRMCPPLTLDEAATLQGSLVMDAVAVACSLRGIATYVACEPGVAHPFFRALAGRHRLSWCDQAGDDLGQRMDHAFTGVFARGHRYAVLVGTDVPTLAVRHYRRAGELLQSCDVVFGPAEDGGYYLVALKRPAPWLFDGIPWSTAGVLARSQERVQAWGLTVGLLDYERDLDTFDDVRAVVVAGCPVSVRTAGVLRMLMERHG
ncbi:MAG: TIGR04282 family arsenosugar biosynthesis glycosyltransferase [Nitrospira sp.]|nr:TIGR04282 family arsenosugar biosynthesis glycosyltransferase [Nitrospira sp.]MDD9860207.1 TIGR04282 family arsenosugar biosynthesis glycosyltransferase [Nitrospira sp.]